MSIRTFIVDTNVLVAGLITREPLSPTAKIVDVMLSGSMFFLLSSALLAEYREVLVRPRLSKAHGLSEPELEQILTEIAANGIWRETAPDKAYRPPDPGDAHLWSLLAFEPMAVLVTGDRMLLENPRPKSLIISPATWAQHFQVSPP